MKLLTLSLALLFILFIKACAAQDSRSSIIDKLISGLYQKHLFNGAIVIGQNGKVIFSKGYGYANFHDSIPFTTHTSSDGGSNAKTLTATSILLLAEEGKLNLNDSVQLYLPNYPYPNTTVWNLITHSVGGLPDYDYFFENAPDTAIVTTSLNLDILTKNKPALNYPCGTNFYYDNVGFDLAALVVERVSGESYFQFLRKNLFHPLNMDSSFVRPDRFINWQQNRTLGYRYKSDSLQLLDITDREVYQFKFRNHDPQIGRFIEIDPLADKYVYNTTYAYSENKVINGFDLEGLEFFGINPSWTILTLENSSIVNRGAIVESVTKVGGESAGKLVEAASKVSSESGNKMPKMNDHHLVPKEFKNDPVISSAREQGFQFEGKENKISLEQFQKANGKGEHGNHPKI